MQEPDFIVIGAGSAGCILAARLAEAGHETLLLEAGGRDLNPLIHVPAGVRYLHGNKRLTWADTARTGAAAGDRTIGWPHGRVIGGSGSINGMIFARGAAADFDQWAQAGCTGWGFDDVAPSFASLETFRGKGGPTRGTEGPLPVETPRFRLPVTGRFLAAAQALGHRRNGDLNSGDPEGAGEPQMNRYGRFRGSSARAFLRRGKRTGKLRVETGVLADRLTFEGTRCTGLIGRRNGQTRTWRARREVIVSAGAQNSPTLLMRSGIGPAEVLAEHGITPVAIRENVGRNLQDHCATRLSFRLRGVQTINKLARPPRVWLEMLRWLTSGRGVLTTGVTAAMVFLRSRPDLAAPDLCLLFSPSSFDADKFGQLERDPGCLVTVSICRPASRGHLTLASTDPSDGPMINAGYLSNPADLPVMLHGIAEARRIMGQSPMADVVSNETLPGAAIDGAALEDYVRGSCNTMFHACGTCRMGSDADAVVDPRLLVRGVSGLRVVDASIMPVIVSGNTNAPTMMIAEHGSKLIIADHAAD